MVGKKEHHERGSELRVEGCLLESSTQLWKRQLAVEQLLCKGVPTCSWPCSQAHLPERFSGIQWSGQSAGSYFWRGGKFVNVQRSGNRFPPPTPFELSVFVQMATIDPVHRPQFLPLLGRRGCCKEALFGADSPVSHRTCCSTANRVAVLRLFSPYPCICLSTSRFLGFCLFVFVFVFSWTKRSFPPWWGFSYLLGESNKHLY